MNNVVFGSVIASRYSLACCLVVFDAVITFRYSKEAVRVTGTIGCV